MKDEVWEFVGGTEPLVFDWIPPEIVTERVGVRTKSGIITMKVTFLIYDDGSIGSICERL